MKSEKTFATLAVVILFFAASCNNMNKTDNNNAVAEKNKEAMKNVFHAFETGNTDSVENWGADNMIEHAQDPNIKATGLQGLKEAIKMYHTAFPDMKQDIMAMWPDKDRVIAHYH